LLPNLTPDEFADIYAETITYGMFAARFHDDDLSSFSRQEALEKLPASNPFLKGLFRYIASTELPRRLEYIVDDLVQVMRASDPHSLFRDFGRFTASNDPFVHFYEDFLAAYDPRKRKSRGVWYTPESVVDFIVRSVDDVLKSEFGLAEGLADTAKVTVDWDTGRNDPKGKPVTIRKEVHKVQILDPATGTGTFLAKAVQLISDRVKGRAPGKWSGYVERELMPRLHGFELLMASYAMCHLKLDMMLTETGYRPSANPPRLSVWLTNALEPAEREVRDLFFQPLAEEARGASEIKRQAPIMCVIGNPPYSGESANKGEHISALIEAYKVEPGGKQRLKEQQTRWLQDDYVKFIRLSEALIARNGSGVLGFITNHSYLDNPTFRGMRWHLLHSFDKVWVMDLHGNSKKKEAAKSGEADRNVFDIQQGVAIIIAVRTSRKAGGLAELFHKDLWGSREAKNRFLLENSLSSAGYESLTHSAPQHVFRPRDHSVEAAYARGVSIAELMPLNSAGILTARDALSIDFGRMKLWERMKELAAANVEAFRRKFEIGADSKSWSLAAAQEDARGNLEEANLKRILLRPFEIRHAFFTGNQGGVQFFPAPKTMVQMARHDNLSLLSCRQTKEQGGAFVTDLISAHKSFSAYDISSVFPLYVYPEQGTLETGRSANFEPALFRRLCEAGGIDPADQAGEGDFRAATGDARPSEVKLFDYIYGVLHSPDYRGRFGEFLRADFPRVPYPASRQVFRHVSEKGEQLRRLHLMEESAIGETPYPYHGEGDDIVASGFPKYESGSVHINKEQHFAGVPEAAWSFHVGGYQPAQKWLKDRRGHSLSWEDILHYQRIVKILAETDRIMKEIELPIEL
jgi:predicted helicase